MAPRSRYSTISGPKADSVQSTARGGVAEWLTLLQITHARSPLAALRVIRARLAVPVLFVVEDPCEEDGVGIMIAWKRRLLGERVRRLK